jgi:hypothetical protein
MTYNDIFYHLECGNGEYEDIDNQCLGFKEIIGHQGPLIPQDKLYKGSRYNVLIDWDYGEDTYEPLHIISADDPVSCALSAKKNGLINMPGWKWFKRFVDNEKMIETIINRAKMLTYELNTKFKYGFMEPNSHQEAVMLDKQNNNTLWHDVIGNKIITGL